MDELDELHAQTIRNVRLLSKWAREQAARIDALNSIAPEACEHCGTSADKCRCEDQRVAA